MINKAERLEMQSLENDDVFSSKETEFEAVVHHEIICLIDQLFREDDSSLTALIVLQNYFPKVMIKALRLLEFGAMGVFIYNPDKQTETGPQYGSGGFGSMMEHALRNNSNLERSDFVSRYGYVDDWGRYIAVRQVEYNDQQRESRVPADKYLHFDAIMQHKNVVKFRDIEYLSHDNDSDDEFHWRYKNLKKYYTRREKVREYIPNKERRWNLNLEYEVDVAVNNVPGYDGDMFDSKFKRKKFEYDDNGFKYYKFYRQHVDSTGRVKRVQQKHKVDYAVVTTNYQEWHCSCEWFKQQSAAAMHHHHDTVEQLQNNKPTCGTSHPRIVFCGGAGGAGGAADLARDDTCRTTFTGPLYGLSGDVVVCEHLLCVLVLSRHYEKFRLQTGISELNRGEWFSMEMEQFSAL